MDDIIQRHTKDKRRILSGDYMKTYTVYQCEYCLSVYNNVKEARLCEAKCLNLTLDEYMEYLELLEREKSVFGMAACFSNDDIRKRCDDVINDIIAFQEKHGITNSRW